MSNFLDKNNNKDIDSSSDSDDGFMSFLKPGAVICIEDEDENEVNNNLNKQIYDTNRESIITIIDHLLLIKDKESIEDLIKFNDNLSPIIINCATLSIKLLSGKHIEIVTSFNDSIFNGDKHPLSTTALLTLCNDDNAAENIGKSIISYIISGETLQEREGRAFLCQIIATTFLELYCQANYSGPELPESDVNRITLSPKVKEEIVESPIALSYLTSYQKAASTTFSTIIPLSKEIVSVLSNLECDGDYPFPTCSIPQTLLISRCILASLAEPTILPWKSGIVLDKNGDINRKANTIYADINGINDLKKLQASTTCIKTLAWRSVRATIVHVRLLQKQRHDVIPTLFEECTSLFISICNKYGGDINEISSSIIQKKDDEKRNQKYCVDLSKVFIPSSASYLPVHIHNRITADKIVRCLSTQLWLERGLCDHYFEYKAKGKLYFTYAKEVSGLSIELTAGMGKRTKWQETEYAQLYIYAKSKLIDDKDSNINKDTITDNKLKLVEKVKSVLVLDDEAKNPNGWTHSEWELGRRLIGEVEGGEEASVRAVMLDSMDGGAAENILFDEGAKFAKESGVGDKGGELHAIDQAIILALCIDVSNNNPSDGLTTEEMLPYIQRVLDLSKNWMITSTALLERSWLEFEKRRTMDRAIMQIQALLDQHTTKLTISQSTYKSIEEAAPCQDRLFYLHCIVYPSQYELKRDLAFRYLTCQIFNSALILFKELEMWDEVVTCYQLLEKPHRAELVVRERLQTEETPYMLTSLADITRDESLYERAWELSNYRFARAKRTLGKICYNRGDYEAAIGHYNQALEVQPLVPAAWYIKGISCMRLGMWEDSLQAFSRCVQQDMEIGEAWANIGAIHMNNRDFNKAFHALQEAYKSKRDSWKVLENLMVVCLYMGKYALVILHMETLLAMRHHSNRPVHKAELGRLAYIVSTEAQIATRKAYKNHNISPSNQHTVSIYLNNSNSTNNDDEEEEIEEIYEVKTFPDLVLQVEALIMKVANSIPSDPDIWNISAEFYVRLGKVRRVYEERTKQFRALITIPKWEKEEESCINITMTAKKFFLPSLSFSSLTKSDIYSCRSLLQTALKKIEINYETSDSYKEMSLMIDTLNKKYDNF